MTDMSRSDPSNPEPGLAPSALEPTGDDIDTPYWTHAKMAQFLRHLSAGHCVSSAARAVRMSRQSAYRLRARLRGQPFDLAWEAAFRHGYDQLAHAALIRALYGVEEDVWFRGEKVGTRRRYDERLTVALLAMANRSGTPRLGRHHAATEMALDDFENLVERVEHGEAMWAEDGDGEETLDAAARDLADSYIDRAAHD
ncbi:MAG: hypothetical protein WA979_12115 [Pacificimonas sp.]